MDNIKSTFIRKRGNNYNVYIEYVDKDTGKLKQKSIAKYGLKKKAERHLIQIKAHIQNKKYIISKDVTIVDFELPIFLIALLGLRKGEVCGLTWDNIYFNNDTVSADKIYI
ncbi:hypothetical protein K0040_18385 [Terrisporobacter petrolearius]|uniref:hypothetical protein n=1 Tax=Terrisporobacter petrolearius TaxID=1460447 RepID=UPI001D162EB1|nr:hypothetical protein [Terrisporobacter petrolearius]MCC3866220.1 hypothetical protein [Terrisporobacter petrolearius]